MSSQTSPHEDPPAGCFDDSRSDCICAQNADSQRFVPEFTIVPVPCGFAIMSTRGQRRLRAIASPDELAPKLREFFAIDMARHANRLEAEAAAARANPATAPSISSLPDDLGIDL